MQTSNRTGKSSLIFVGQIVRDEVGHRSHTSVEFILAGMGLCSRNAQALGSATFGCICAENATTPFRNQKGVAF